MKEKIASYIKDNILAADQDISDSDDLLNTGLIDSIGVIKLISYLEEEFNVSIPPEEMIIENFINVDAIASYISSARN